MVTSSGMNSNGVAFTIVPAPSITSVSPTSGPVGTPVTISGTNFGSTGAVTFNENTTTTTSWTATSIVTSVPTGATTGNVVVKASGVNSNGVGFAVSYPDSYQYRRTIVLGHVNVPNTDQTDFPVLISGTYSYLATIGNGGLVQNSSGYDIIFSLDPEGGTKLDHEIDGYNPVTGTVAFWVRIPTLSHTSDTVIYLFYGNPNITSSQENKSGVWKNGYASVYHLGNGTTLGLTDSGSAGYTLTGSAAAVTGKIGGGAAFNGNPGTYLYYDSVSAYPSGESPVTLETWVQLASSTGNVEILGYGGNSANGSRDAFYWDGSNILMELENMAVSGPMPFNNSWHHLVSVYGGGALSTSTDQLYLDGVPLSTSTGGGWPALTTTEFKIGGIPTVTSCCALSGSVDEVRVSTVVRSADWVATEYANESSPSTFYTVEGQVTSSSAPTIQLLSPAAGAIGAVITIQGAGFQPTQGGSAVMFNGVAATPMGWNDAAIVVPVPAGAANGNVIVTVGGVASNGVSFTVLPTPTIINLNPASGVIGTPITITGTNFGSAQGASAVTFAGAIATPTSWNATTITVPVPVGATTGNVVATVNGGTSNPAGFTVVPSLRASQTFRPRRAPGREPFCNDCRYAFYGATQGASTVTLNAASAAVASWSDTSIVVIVPTGASSGPFSVTVSGQVANSPSFAVTAIPSGWTDSDVGPVGGAGSAAFSNTIFTVAGTGGGIGGTADAMHFVYQTLVGDGSIIAQVTSSPYSAQAGVMIRQTLNPSSTDTFTYFYPNQAYLLYRPTSGANVTSQPVSYSQSPNFPYWLQLVRAGNTFTGYVSPDGVNWTPTGASTTISMTQNVYVGLAVSGGTATFTSVSVNSTAAPAPVITELSPTTVSVGTQVAIEGDNFGATQGGSLVLLNGTPIAVNSWSNTGIAFTVAAGATSGPLTVSVAPSMNDSNPVHLEVTGQPLPTSWLNDDVGGVGGLTGTSTFSGGTYTVSGAGSAIGGTADAMQFIYQALEGDGSIIARLTSLQEPPYPGASQAGVMIRETLNPGATEASVFYGYNSATYMQDRQTTGATAVYANSGTYGYAPPEWMKLVRAGNTFTGYVSPDGFNWTLLGTTTVSMAQTVYIGLVVSGGNYLETGTFDNVSINSAANPAPVITGLSATTASIGSQVEITGNNFGASQGGSILLLNGNSIAINLWTNTSIVFTVPTGATSGLLVVSVAPTMNDSNPVTLTVTSQPLPDPWLDQDVGVVGTLIGSATYSSGVFTVAGGGYGIGGTADSMHFVYQPLPGNGSIIARITNLPAAPYPNASQGGVMIRETLSAGATEAYALVGPNIQAWMLNRTTTGAAAVYSSAQTGAPPVWLELVRAGNTFTGFVSPDGTNWTQLGSTTISMAQTAYIGLAVSGNDSVSAATFDNVSVTVGTTPFVSSVSPIVGTIGTPVTITGSNFGTTQGSSTISFNGASAGTATSWSSSQIVATVPSSAPNGTGPVTVTVNSVSSPITSSSVFTVVHPVIGSLGPSSGPVGGTLVINGSGFGATQNGVVLVNGVSASIAGTCLQNPWYACWSDTQIQVIIPTTTSGLVTVSNDGIVSNSLPFTITPPPVITSLSPTTGEPTTIITIGGTSFGASQSNSTVAVAGLYAHGQ